MAINRIKPFKDNNRGMVYLVATPIGNIKDISLRAKEVLEYSDIILAEDTRNTSLLLKRLGITCEKFVSCYSQNESEVAEIYLKDVQEHDLTLSYVSDAGTPGISDPGCILVSKAISMNIKVSAILGPSAFIQGLILSGFDTADFSFYGFLPVKENERKSFLENLVSRKETLLFYEAPHRLLKTLKTMKEVFVSRRVVLCRELSKIYEEYIRGDISELALLDENSIKGEFVIVVEGNKSGNVNIDSELLIKANKLAKLGYKNSEISKILASLYPVSKNHIYSLINKGDDDA